MIATVEGAGGGVVLADCDGVGLGCDVVCSSVPACSWSMAFAGRGKGAALTGRIIFGWSQAREGVERGDNQKIRDVRLLVKTTIKSFRERAETGKRRKNMWWLLHVDG